MTPPVPNRNDEVRRSESEPAGKVNGVGPAELCLAASDPAACSTSGDNSTGRIDDQNRSHSDSAADVCKSVNRWLRPAAAGAAQTSGYASRAADSAGERRRDPPDGDDQRVQLRDVVEHLQRHRTLARRDLGVVIRMDEGQALLRRQRRLLKA